MFSTAFDAYVDLSFIGLYQAWVQLFGWLVWAAVALSVLVAVDRLVQVVGHCWAMNDAAHALCASRWASASRGVQIVDVAPCRIPSPWQPPCT